MAFATVALFVVAIVGATIYGIVHASSEGHLDWPSATLAHATESPLASATTLLISRIVCGAIVWLTCVYLIMSKESIEIQYGRRTIQLVGWTRFTTFTVWCWILMGIYFALAASMSAVRVSMATEGSREHIHGNLMFPPWALMAVWVLYELSFAMSLLVSTVVTFVLIPAAKKYNYNTDALFRWAPLVMHNCNVAFMFLELYLNGMQFNACHVLFVIMFGCTYILFAWYWFSRTGVFYYFFLDYRQKWALVSYLALIGAVSGFFALGDILSNALKPRVDF